MAEDRATEEFLKLSDEYAQALEALDAIERQAERIVAGGNEAELRAVVAHFHELATRASASARQKGQERFAEWFEELIRRVDQVQRKALS
jgi:short-subunit dehydrogenase involved in D-alanine esterification of teichoic acids